MNIYIHIPFCHSKCAYCAFLSHCDNKKEDKYVDEVCREILVSPHLSSRAQSRDLGSISTIYFGGGTPSMIKPENVAKIIETIKSDHVCDENIEVTLECNPEDISEMKLALWKKAGVNRLSIGIQSFNDDTRKIIGRKLTAGEAIVKVDSAKKYFENVGIDLIANLPNDKFASLEVHVPFLKTLNHISLYDLEIDNASCIGTNPEKYMLPTEDLAANNLLKSWKLLDSLGYEQYEISNFAQDNRYCRHNLDFWNGKDYLGFGVGAVSRIGNKIITNSHDFNSYIGGKNDTNIETLSNCDIKKFALVSALRLNRSFAPEFINTNSDKEILDELMADNFITLDMTVTTKGKLVYNQLIKRMLT